MISSIFEIILRFAVSATSKQELNKELEIPGTFKSIWAAQIPFLVWEILKSMSPYLSSQPSMSVKITLCSSCSFFVTKPSAIPETVLLSGTPAAISESDAAQIDACEVDPFEDKTSETTRIVYGKTSVFGKRFTSAFFAKKACPTSLREGE